MTSVTQADLLLIVAAAPLVLLVLLALLYRPITCFVCDGTMFRGRDGKLHCSNCGRTNDNA